jgi:L-asparagine transporter-like permease
MNKNLYRYINIIVSFVKFKKKKMKREKLKLNLMTSSLVLLLIIWFLSLMIGLFIVRDTQGNRK